MNKPEKFSWRKRAKAFKYAKEGARALLQYEHNFRIHLCAAVIVVILGFIFSISPIEWCVILLCIGGVFCAEGLNSALEVLCDRISTQQDEAIKRAKDIAAASVFFLAFAALIIGLIIFIPKLMNLL